MGGPQVTTLFDEPPAPPKPCPTGQTLTWWLPYPNGAYALSCQHAAERIIRGDVVFLGTYAEAVEVGREVPE